jgi:hypothetical protein
MSTFALRSTLCGNVWSSAVRRFALLFLALPFSLQPCLAVQQAWVAKYNNGPGTRSVPVAMSLDKDGNIYVAGHSTKTNAPFDYDYVIVKYNSMGIQQWVNRYGLPDVNEQVQSMVVNTSGDVFLTGSNETVRYFTSGLLAWSAPYAGRDIGVDTNGNSYVTGFAPNDFSTVKLNASGSNIWLRTWDRAGLTDWSKKITLDRFGNVFVGGMAMWYCDRAGCYAEPYILKYNSDGTAVWTNLFEHAAYSIYTQFYGFTCDAEGSLYLALSALGFGVCCDWDAAKIGVSGEWSWFRSLTFTAGGNGVRAMVLDTNGNAYYTGNARCYKITAKGADIWNAQYPGRGNAIGTDAEGNAYVTGQSTGIGTGNDYATIKYSTNGQQLWVKRFSEAGDSDDQAQAIALGPNGEVYVTGFSNPTNGLYEITTIKYVQVSPIEKKSNGNILLTFCGTPGSNYVIEACSSLINWTNIGSATANSSGIYTFEDTNAPLYRHRFYRTVTE